MENGQRVHKDGCGLKDIGNKSQLKNGNFFMHRKKLHKNGKLFKGMATCPFLF